jgi:hypothetical protein
MTGKRPGMFGIRKGRKGMALVLVTMALTAMLLLGTAFMQDIRLDLKASVQYATAGTTELYAMEGLHRGMAELMYDVWGVNEDKAFVCSAEWGMMSQGFGVNGTPMMSAYAYDGAPAGQVTAGRSRWRRVVLDDNLGLETDYTWVGEKNEQSGGYYWDEFLPEGVDNCDAWEVGLHANHGKATDRNYYRDATPTGGLWAGRFWPANRGGEGDPWDYIDTRIVPDSFYHIFRFDLVDRQEHKVWCTGVRYEDPKQLIRDVKTDGDFRATHLEYATGQNWKDVWGGALNINKVNNNYQWEQYYNWRAYDDVKAWTPHHYAEAKWINIYDVSGQRILGRYAVTVWPDNGNPNANYLFDAVTGGSPDWSWGQSKTADYLVALDGAFLPHGKATGNGDNPDGMAPYNVNNIKAKTPRKLTWGNWAHNVCTEINEHIRANGMITSRSEVGIFIRKNAFQEYDNASGTDNSPDAVNDARIISSCLTTAGYDYLLDPHWEMDRMVVDSTGLQISGSKIYQRHGLESNEPEGQRTRKYFNYVLNSLRYYWGPDDYRIDKDGARSAALGFSTNYTPYHEPGSLKTDAYQPDPLDSPDPNSPVNMHQLAKMERAKKSRAAAISWISTNPEHWGYFGNRSAWAVNIDTWEVKNQRKVAAGEHDRWVLSMSLPHAINEVGKYSPKYPCLDGGARSRGPKYFDGTKEYYFVELLQPSSYDAGHTQMVVAPRIYVGGQDVVQNVNTRVVCIDKDGTTQDERESTGTTSVAWVDNNSAITTGFARTECYNKYCGAQFQKDSFVRNHPNNFVVVYFPTDAGYDGDEVIYADASDNVLDYVKLPGRISALQAGKSYSAYDYRYNDSPQCWQICPSTPSFRVLMDAGTYSLCNPPLWRNGVPTGLTSARWASGMNLNYYSYMWPLNRQDIDGVAGPFSWTAAGHESNATSHYMYYHFKGPQEMRKIPTAFTPITSLDDVQTFSGAYAPSAQVYPSTGYSDEYSVFRPWDMANKESLGYLMVDYYDPNLRIWDDLYKVTPIERYFDTGVLSCTPYWAAGAVPGDDKNYPLFDGFDNNMDGMVDDLVPECNWKHLNDLGLRGHFVGDRKAIGRTNINELAHPAAVYYSGVYADYNQLVQVGRKPFKGYVSLWAMPSRTFYYHGDDTPYNKLVWRENLFGDCSSEHIYDDMLRELDTNMMFTCRQGYVGNSPVYTLYITAQTVKQDELDPCILTAVAETKMRATVERTWDGKMNVLEFNWIPQDVY